ncbi:hypothetical protein CPC08DRAFT_692672 [Agrocybe pediades]|nr:hypothetical protein CPC08DRAFT_692672 [Agrocybe pediades]
MLLYLAFASLSRRSIVASASAIYNFNPAFPSHGIGPALVLDSTSNDCICKVTRSLWDIVWGCLATIFACSWVAVHPNLPSPADGKVKITLRRIELMLFTIIAPELVILWAVNQWSCARSVEKKYKDRGWTKVHGYFIQMGGFMLFEGDQRKGVLTLTRFEELLQLGRIQFPSISEEDILDRSKGDGLGKALVVVQTTWFIIQCLARLIQHLDLTELELFTAALAVLNGAMYLFWRKKPLSVGISIPVYLLPSPEQPTEKCKPSVLYESIAIQTECSSTVILTLNQLPETGEKSRDIFLKESNKENNTSVMVHPLADSNENKREDIDAADPSSSASKQAPSFVSPNTLGDSGPSTLWTATMPTSNDGRDVTLADDDESVASIHYVFLTRFPHGHRKLRRQARQKWQDAWRPIRPIANFVFHLDDELVGIVHPPNKSDMRVPTFHSSRLLDQDRVAIITKRRSILVYGLAAIFGAIHTAGWTFFFPSNAERIAWRVSSVIITVLPAFCIVQAIIRRHQLVQLGNAGMTRQTLAKFTSPGGNLIGLVLMLLGFVYALARVSLLILALGSLRRLPESTYDEVQWTTFIPHI